MIAFVAGLVYGVFVGLLVGVLRRPGTMRPVGESIRPERETKTGVRETKPLLPEPRQCECAFCRLSRHAATDTHPRRN